MKCSEARAEQKRPERPGRPGGAPVLARTVQPPRLHLDPAFSSATQDTVSIGEQGRVKSKLLRRFCCESESITIFRQACWRQPAGCERGPR